MVHAVVKRWGNSFGIVLPRDLVRERRLVENEIVEIEITRTVPPPSSLFGTLKTKRSTQKMKDEMRDGWDG